MKKYIYSKTCKLLFLFIAIFFVGSISLKAQDTEPPSVPTNLHIVSLDRYHVTLAWNASTDNSGGLIKYMKSSSQTVWGEIDDSTTNTTYTINFGPAYYALPGQYFRIRFAAKDASNNISGFSNVVIVTIPPAPDTQAPTAPTNLRVISLTHTQLVVAWNASTDNVGVTKYLKNTCQTICGIIDDSTTALTYTINFNALWYTLPGQWFLIQFAAKDAAGNVSPFSNQLTINIPPAPIVADTQAPTVPTNFVFSNLTFAGVQFNWNASIDNIGVTGYEIVYNGGLLPSPLPPDGLAVAYTSLTNSLYGTGLPSGTHTYFVRAVDAAGNKSAVSNGVTFTLPPPPPNIPPVSKPTVLNNTIYPLTVYVNQPIQFADSSTDADGQIVEWLWGFGDGSTSALKNPVFAYTASIFYFYPTGMVNVSLKVKDNNGAVDTKTVAIQVLSAPDIIPPTTPSNLRVVSLDRQHLTVAWDASTDNSGGIIKYMKNTFQTIAGNIDDSTTALTYTINFNASWYALPGQWFKIQFAAKDVAGNLSPFSNQLTINIPPAPVTPNIPPVALPRLRINPLPYTDFVNYPIQFADSSNDADGQVVSWLWTFGDGSTSTIKNPIKTYNTAGNYVVSLRVTDNGAATDTKTISIQITTGIDTQAPTAPTNFNYSNLTASGVQFNWNASTDNIGVAGYEIVYIGGLLPSPLPPDGLAIAYTSLTNSFYGTALPSGTHTYFVRALDAAGNKSAVSNGVTFTTPTPIPPADVTPPTVPANLRIVSLDYYHVTLTWDVSTDDVAGVIKYMKSSSQTVWGDIDDSTTANTYTINFSPAYYALPGQYFRIRFAAKDVAGNLSGFSNIIRVDIPNAPITISSPIKLPKHVKQGASTIHSISLQGNISTQTFVWLFGDGYITTGIGLTSVAHTYANNGLFPGKFCRRNNNGTTDTLASFVANVYHPITLRDFVMVQNSWIVKNTSGTIIEKSDAYDPYFTNTLPVTNNNGSEEGSTTLSFKFRGAEFKRIENSRASDMYYIISLPYILKDNFIPPHSSIASDYTFEIYRNFLDTTIIETTKSAIEILDGSTKNNYSITTTRPSYYKNNDAEIVISNLSTDFDSRYTVLYPYDNSLIISPMSLTQNRAVFRCKAEKYTYMVSAGYDIQNNGVGLVKKEDIIIQEAEVCLLSMVVSNITVNNATADITLERLNPNIVHNVNFYINNVLGSTFVLQPNGRQLRTINKTFGGFNANNNYTLRVEVVPAGQLVDKQIVSLGFQTLSQKITTTTGSSILQVGIPSYTTINSLVYLLDANGNTMRKYNYTGVRNFSWNVADLPNGVYFISVTIDQRNYSQQIVIMK